MVDSVNRLSDTLHGCYQGGAANGPELGILIMKEKDAAPALRERILDEAFAVIADVGVERLSIREIARRIGVSHQAPYKHFRHRDDIISGLIARIFDEFAQALGARAPFDDPHDDLRSMGEAYVRFALERPLEYKLMFGTPLHGDDAASGVEETTQKAFSILEDRLSTMALRQAGPVNAPRHDAFFIWSTLHGWVTIMQSGRLASMGITDDQIPDIQQRVFARLDGALNPSA